MGRPLTRQQHDLAKYAQKKMQNYMRDVVQAFVIANEEQAEAVACLGSQCIRVGAALAVHAGADRERWLRMCSDVYELAVEAAETADNLMKGD